MIVTCFLLICLLDMLLAIFYLLDLKAEDAYVFHLLLMPNPETHHRHKFRGLCLDENPKVRINLLHTKYQLFLLRDQDIVYPQARSHLDL